MDGIFGSVYVKVWSKKRCRKKKEKDIVACPHTLCFLMSFFALDIKKN